MAGVRDDSGGSYGQWQAPDDWSWLDHIKAAGSDTGNALYNLGSNVAGGLSPFAPTATQYGQPSLQVPPMIQGIADSYSRLAGTPSKPGNAYDLTGVPEVDAPIQGDMSNVLLSMYGGNAAGGLAKPALSSVAGRVGEGMADHATAAYKAAKYRNEPSAVNLPDDALWDRFGFEPRSAGESPNALANYSTNDGTILANYPDWGWDSYGSIGGPNRRANDNIAGARTSLHVADEWDSLLSDTGKPSILGTALATAGEQPKGITAYHGSPHDFDKFSLDKIGTGEGAQAYGHGLYFADNEAVAQTYKGAGPVQQWSSLDPPQIDGKMYQVRINAEPDSFLDWDKPISQQGEQVLGFAKKELEGYGNGRDPFDMLGSEFYRGTGNGRSSGAAALREAGIPGIRYLDGNSRGAGEGSSNYVVFDDSLIEILKKYGLAGGAAGAGALNSLSQDPAVY